MGCPCRLDSLLLFFLLVAVGALGVVMAVVGGVAGIVVGVVLLVVAIIGAIGDVFRTRVMLMIFEFFALLILIMVLVSLIVICTWGIDHNECYDTTLNLSGFLGSGQSLTCPSTTAYVVHGLVLLIGSFAVMLATCVRCQIPRE